MKTNLPSLLTGLLLIAIGAISLVANTFLKVEAWRIWPMIVLLAGLGLLTPTLFSFKRPGLGAFFFPGMPTFTTGAILMYASLTGHWEVWAFAWTLIVLSVGVSFILAAFAMRTPGLAIPAAIITINGLALGFTAFTGMWQAWALIWPVEPLAVGIGLLILAFFNRSSGTRTAGIILCAIAGGGFFMMSLLSVFNATALRFTVPAMLIFTGAILILSFFIRTDNRIEAPVETPAPVSE